MSHLGTLGRFEHARAIASQSAGFITLSELADLGVPDSTVRRWARKGLITRFHPGVYRMDSGLLDFEDTLFLAGKLMNSQQAIAAKSAAQLWDLPGGSRSRVQVIGPTNVRLRSPHLAVRQAADLLPVDVSNRRGLRVTTPLRTLFDIGAQTGPKRLGQFLTAGVQQGHFTYDEVLIRGRELARKGKQGVRPVLAELAFRVDTPERDVNSYESTFLDLTRRAGFPRPESQFRVSVNGCTYYLDFFWKQWSHATECDSMLAHSSPEQLQADLERQNNILSLDLTLSRFTHRHVTKEPDYVIDTLNKHIPRSPRPQW